MSGELDTYTSYPCHSRRQSFATMSGEEKGDTVSSTSKLGSKAEERRRRRRRREENRSKRCFKGLASYVSHQGSVSGSVSGP